MTRQFNLSSAYEGPPRQIATGPATQPDERVAGDPPAPLGAPSLGTTGSRAVAGGPVADGGLVAELRCGGDGWIEFAVGECEVGRIRCAGCPDCEEA
jgi:hypothetical protein